MNRKMVDGDVTISRLYCDSPRVEITFCDKESRTSITAHLGIEDFAESLLGLAHTQCKLELPVRPENFGKTRQSKPIEVVVDSRDKDAATEKVKASADEGWVANTPAWSKSTFFEKDGQLYCRSNQVRWIDSVIEEK